MLSQRIKRPEPEADHSSPPTVEIRMSGAIPPSPMCIHGMHRTVDFMTSKLRIL
jgi:hypothetical protein